MKYTRISCFNVKTNCFMWNKKLFRSKFHCMENVCWANEVQLMEYFNIWSTLLNINTIRIKQKDKEKTKTISTSLIIMITTQSATTTNQVRAVCYIGWRNTWMGPKYECVNIYNYFMRLNNPSQIKKKIKQLKN